MEQVCTGVALMQECTARTRAALVSFGERMSTCIFSSHTRWSMRLRSTQHDAFDALGCSTDAIENGNILPVTYENGTLREGADARRRAPTARAGAKSVANIARLVANWASLGEASSRARSRRSPRPARPHRAARRAAQGAAQVYVVEGRGRRAEHALAREVEGTVAMAFLSFQEATELAYFGAQVLHPQSMRPAMDSEALCVRVKNRDNVRARPPRAAGTSGRAGVRAATGCSPRSCARRT